jgi:hypothetical protein
MATTGECFSYRSLGACICCLLSKRQKNSCWTVERMKGYVELAVAHRAGSTCFAACSELWLGVTHNYCRLLSCMRVALQPGPVLPAAPQAPAQLGG